MTTLITQTVLAYVNHGRWIAECPRQFCNNAVKLTGGETTFRCLIKFEGCGQEATIVWPPNAQEIWDALLLRPVPSTRNWFPFGHDLAVRFRMPAGQTPKELLDEQKLMEEAERNG